MSAPCPHARPDWRACPHCLGLNYAPGPAATTITVTPERMPSQRDPRPQRAMNRRERRRARALGLLAVLIALSTPARALDCSTVTITPGAVLTEDAAECLRLSVVSTDLRAETCEAQLVASRIETDACHATAQITCPPPEPPVGPVVVAGVVGVVLGVVATVALLLAVPR